MSALLAGISTNPDAVAGIIIWPGGFSRVFSDTFTGRVSRVSNYTGEINIKQNKISVMDKTFFEIGPTKYNNVIYFKGEIIYEDDKPIRFTYSPKYGKNVFIFGCDE